MRSATVTNLQLLRWFDVLMSERSVSRAAAKAGIGQPAMSHALARLRTLFNDPLLLRTQGRMTPTNRAIELHERIRTALGIVDELFTPQGGFDPASTEIKFTIMAPEFVEYLVAPSLAKRLQVEAPGVDVEFRSPDPDHALELLEHKAIDFRLGFWRSPAPTLHSQPLFRERLVCIARIGHPDIKSGITAEQYLRARHVRVQLSPSSSVSMQAIDQIVAKRRARLRVALRVHDAHTMGHVVAQSDLIATMTQRLAQRLADEIPIQIFPLPLPLSDDRTALYWHESSHLQPSHRWFRRLLVEVCRRFRE